MKRLLLAPLLIAITGCSNDITFKTDLGEKYIVKSTAVVLEEEPIENFLFKMTFYRDENLKTVNEYKSTLLYFENRYANCKSELGKDSLVCDAYPPDISYWKEQAIDAEEYLKKQEYVVKNINQTIKKHNKDTILFSIVKYTPIFEDLNGKKIVQNRTEVRCENPSIDFKDLGMRNKFLNSLERKICNKYAKF